MRALVTGAAGFLGAHIAAALAADPRVEAVTGLDRVAPADRAGTRFIGADIAEIERVAPAADLAVHAAALTSQASEADPAAARRINLEGTRAVLRWAAAQPTPPRVLLLSSIAVLGSGEAVAREDTAPAPRSVYGATKLAAERLLQDAARRDGADAVVLRLPVTLVRTAARTAPPGAGFLSDLIDAALRGRPFAAPLPPAHAIPVASLRVVTGLVLRAALGPVPARLLHVPSLAGSAAAALEALAGMGIDARGITCRPDPRVARLVEGWPARLGTLHPAFSDDLADKGLEPIIRAHAARLSA